MYQDAQTREALANAIVEATNILARVEPPAACVLDWLVKPTPQGFAIVVDLTRLGYVGEPDVFRAIICVCPSSKHTGRPWYESITERVGAALAKHFADAAEGEIRFKVTPRD